MEQFIQNSWIALAVSIWILPWKGWSLWIAARKGAKWWFIALLVINTLAVLEILYIFVFSKKCCKEGEGKDNCCENKTSPQ